MAICEIVQTFELIGSLRALAVAARKLGSHSEKDCIEINCIN
jgi:hypothetical protein